VCDECVCMCAVNGSYENIPNESESPSVTTQRHVCVFGVG
jgi:hypothetical protein